MHLLAKNIEWDTDGMNPETLGLPSHILVLDAPNAEAEYLCLVMDEISEVYGFCHNGFEVEIIEPDVRGCKHKWNLANTAIMQAPVEFELDLSQANSEDETAE